MTKTLLVSAILLSLGPYAASALSTTESDTNTVRDLQEQQARPTVFIASIFGGFAMAKLDQLEDNSPVKGSDDTFNTINSKFNYQPDTTLQKNPFAGIFLGAESRITPTMALQYGLSYNAPATFKASGSSTETSTSDIAPSGEKSPERKYDYSYKVKTRQLLAEVKLLGTLSTNFHPYALVGLGTSSNKASDFKQTPTTNNTNLPTASDVTSYKDKESTVFSYKLGVGVDYDVTAHWRVGLGYHFADLGTVDLGEGSSPGFNNRIPTPPIKLSGLKQSHLYSNELIAQLSFIF